MKYSHHVWRNGEKRPAELAICLHCGKPFLAMVRYERGKNRIALCCSRPCLWASMSSGGAISESMRSSREELFSMDELQWMDPAEEGRMYRRFLSELLDGVEPKFLEERFGSRFRKFFAQASKDDKKEATRKRYSMSNYITGKCPADVNNHFYFSARKDFDWRKYRDMQKKARWDYVPRFNGVLGDSF